MKPGERLQYACGHWLLAGTFGIQDDSVKDVPNKRCGPCRKRLEGAAPQLLEALEELVDIAGCSHYKNQAPRCSYCKARAAIERAKEAK